MTVPIPPNINLSALGISGGGGSYGTDDAKFREQLGEVKRRGKSGKDKIAELLASAGIDPRDLDLRTDEAVSRMIEISRGVSDSEWVVLSGNSLGLNQVRFFDADNSDGVANSDAVLVVDATHPDSRVDWHDCKRAWAAFRKQIGGMFPTFTINTNEWADHTVQAGQPTPVRFKDDPTKYPAGSVLLIERIVFSPEPKPERQYVRVGGLFNDADIVNLDNMQPIGDLSGWTVIEELA